MSAVTFAFVSPTGEVQYSGDLIMRRHRKAPASYWLVSLLPAPSVYAFFRLQDADDAHITALAVVDDFGTLVRVSS